MSVITPALTENQVLYVKALTKLGFAAKKNPATFVREATKASPSVTVKLSSDGSIKVTALVVRAGKDPKETTQTFFPPASNFSTGIVMDEVRSLIG